MAASRYAAFCDLHKRRMRRHGDPRQQAITVHELRPYRLRVRAKVQKNSSNPAWNIVSERWNDVVKIARSELAHHQGKPANRYDREAWADLVKLADNVDASEIVETISAMYLLLEERPRRFESDAAFCAQLVRRVRGLTLTNAAEYHDHKSRKTKLVYRDPKPKTTARLAALLNATFGSAGIAVARLEQREAETAAGEKAALHSALGALEYLCPCASALFGHAYALPAFLSPS
jgi:hypothetical protein